MAKSGPIIIVEDDPEDQELLQEAFVQLGVQNEVHFFTDGKQAIDFLLMTTEQPFLIITDINLPQLNGLQFQHIVQENEYLRKKSIPFIFLSTTDNPRTVEQAYDQTVQGYFKKPGDFRQLKETLQSIIDYWMRCRHPNSTGV